MEIGACLTQNRRISKPGASRVGKPNHMMQTTSSTNGS